MRVKKKSSRSFSSFPSRLRMLFFILTVTPATTIHAAAAVKTPLTKRFRSVVTRRALANRSSCIRQQTVALDGVSRTLSILMETDIDPIGANPNFHTPRLQSQADEGVVAQRRRTQRNKGRKSKKNRKSRRQSRG